MRHPFWKCFCLLVVLAAKPVFAGDPVAICDDQAEWPPYTYYARTADGIDKTRIQGATAELVAAIFDRIGLKYSYDLLPWNRCMYQVANFADLGRYEIVANASYNKERAKLYYASTPLYQTRYGVAFTLARFPNGPKIDRLEKLRKFHLCAPSGYNIAMYDLTPAQVSSSNRSYREILNRVSHARCDLGLVSIGVVRGLAQIEDWSVPENVILEPLRQIKPITFHLLISRTSPRAQQLSVSINEAIIDLQQDGTAGRILEAHTRIQY
ncbi:substrate-binding periplasmic protein [Aestuariispira insulae]|uniref:Amino acid ABC transporter substrate-binding protein (PAAT family) n=1 Tax=Aestuariispira insulae TaxID=1461337 RepID=A0A3D9H9I2_9PROT|nr:transporter substrate-binding domain-containing protein [Aestuariispira insulae]RED46154.1 amino acid ABC transporter substrate-binding protein (PAAT family) [Aestuariispira insulae]